MALIPMCCREVSLSALFPTELAHPDVDGQLSNATCPPAIHSEHPTVHPPPTVELTLSAAMLARAGTLEGGMLCVDE